MFEKVAMVEKHWHSKLLEAAQQINIDLGMVYESLFETALQTLQEDGLVTEFTKTERNSPDDKLRVDYWIHISIDDVEERIPLQLKSTFAEARKGRRNKKGYIPTVYVRNLREGGRIIGQEQLVLQTKRVIQQGIFFRIGGGKWPFEPED